MPSSTSNGLLYLNEQYVGAVNIRGWEGAWGIGYFTPAAAFEEFAAAFVEWSRLMHSREAQRGLSRGVAERLRRIESELYALRASMYVPGLKRWRQIAILNIDGPLIEWKERWSADDCDDRTGAAAATAAAPEAQQLMAGGKQTSGLIGKAPAATAFAGIPGVPAMVSQTRSASPVSDGARVSLPPTATTFAANPLARGMIV